MNIFASDMCPVQSALNLDDLRVNKMITESCQMLSTVQWRAGKWQPILMEPAYTGHPCTKWAYRTQGNYEWLVTHLFALIEAYRATGGTAHRRASELVPVFFEMMPNIKPGDLEPFANATPFKGPQWENMSTIEKYRKTLQMKWNSDHRSPTWNNRKEPTWL